jgi:hypothetical protein
VHGDFGPNNIPLDPDTLTVTTILDGEWAHPGEALEDLAWCEWIVCSYHSEHVSALEKFFTAYGSRPAWPLRHQHMVSQARSLADNVRLSSVVGRAPGGWDSPGDGAAESLNGGVYFAIAYPQDGDLLVQRHMLGDVSAVVDGAGRAVACLVRAGLAALRRVDGGNFPSDVSGRDRKDRRALTQILGGGDHH